MSKVTDQLLAMAAAAGRAIATRHSTCAARCASGTSPRPANCWAPDFTPNYTAELQAEFDSLEQLLRGISAVGELTPRTSDYVVSFGERLSSMVVTAAFVARDIPATLLDARKVIITDGAAWPRDSAGRGDQPTSCRFTCSR